MQLPCRLAASGVDSIPSRLLPRATGIGKADACASAVVPVLLRLLPLRAYARSDAGQGAGINRFSCGKTWGLGPPLVRLLYFRYWPITVVAEVRLDSRRQAQSAYQRRVSTCPSRKGPGRDGKPFPVGKLLLHMA